MALFISRYFHILKQSLIFIHCFFFSVRVFSICDNMSKLKKKHISNIYFIISQIFHHLSIKYNSNKHAIRSDFYVFVFIISCIYICVISGCSLIYSTLYIEKYVIYYYYLRKNVVLNILGCVGILYFVNTKDYKHMFNFIL